LLQFHPPIPKQSVENSIMDFINGAGLSRVLMGSVAEDVARRSPCPVLVVRVDNPMRIVEDEDAFEISDRYNSPLSGWIAQVFVITLFSATERILPVFVREAKAL